MVMRPYFYNGIKANMKNKHWLPVLSDNMCQVLTPKQLTYLGVNMVSIHLAHLLSRPYLQKMDKKKLLASFFPGDFRRVLNLNPSVALKPKFTQNGYQFRSPIDGHKVEVDYLECFKELKHAAIDLWILPLGAYELASDEIKANSYVFDTKDLNQQSTFFKAYPHYKKDLLVNDETSTYLCGKLSRAQIKDYFAKGVEFIETGTPIEEALSGKLYLREDNYIDIHDSIYALDYRPIESECGCSTCQQFTRAYLHHLSANTPLLSQRFQVIHNIYAIINF